LDGTCLRNLTIGGNPHAGAPAAAQWHMQPADRSSALLIGLHHE